MLLQGKLENCIEVAKALLWTILSFLKSDINLKRLVSVNFGAGAACDIQHQKEGVVFVDGSAENGRAGIGVWYRPGYPLNFNGRISGRVDNNRAELAAIVNDLYG